MPWIYHTEYKANPLALVSLDKNSFKIKVKQLHKELFTIEGTWKLNNLFEPTQWMINWVSSGQNFNLWSLFFFGKLTVPRMATSSISSIPKLYYFLHHFLLLKLGRMLHFNLYLWSYKLVLMLHNSGISSIF